MNKIPEKKASPTPKAASSRAKPKEWEPEDKSVAAFFGPADTPEVYNPFLAYTNLIKDFNVRELLMLRDEIDKKLPARSLKDLDLDQELIHQYLKTKELQQTVLEGASPDNQKAQVANAVASILQSIIKMQGDLHTAERFKALEAMMISAIALMPPDAAEKFVLDYEALGDGDGSEG